MLAQIKADLQSHANPEKATFLARFFKTGKGQYAEGDKFLGITVPNQRKVAKKYYKQADIKTIQALLKSPIHEHRLTALFLLVYKYEKSTPEDQAKITDFYLKNTKYINNWDLVDSSAHKILGHYLLNKDRKILYKLAKSKDLWERRIAILSTYTFIKNKDFKDALAISEILVKDKHDLIHKAVGWMLREIGKLDQSTEEEFLKKHHKTMPRTMLRYAIEKFSPGKKKFYMSKD